VTVSARPRISMPRGRQGSVLARSSITMAAWAARATSRYFLLRAELAPSHVDAVVHWIVRPHADRSDVRGAVGADGGNAGEPTLAEIGQLRGREHAHARTPFHRWWVAGSGLDAAPARISGLPFSTISRATRRVYERTRGRRPRTPSCHVRISLRPASSAEDDSPTDTSGDGRGPIGGPGRVAATTFTADDRQQRTPR
jgi:hypothetical protein